MANQLTRYATVATVDTADQGGFAGGIINPVSVPVGGAVFPVANTVYCLRMVLSFRCTVGSISSRVTVLQTSSNYGLGLYDMSGNLVVRTPAISTTVGGPKRISTSTTVVVEAGPYWFCWSGDDVLIELMRWNLDSYVGDADLAQILATAANASSAGVLPATLGTRSNDNSGILIPATYFEP